MLTKIRVTEILRGLRERNVVVLGDVMLDEFVWGDVTRISPEAPVPVVDVRRESVRLGGAANVLANLVALGARASVVGVVGRDAAGGRLRAGVRARGAPRAGGRRRGGAPRRGHLRAAAGGGRARRLRLRQGRRDAARPGSGARAGA